MTTGTTSGSTTTGTAAAATTTSASRVLTLAVAETRLILRNRTVAVSSVLLPVVLGVFWAFQFGIDVDPVRHAVSLTLQLSVALTMGLYLTATQTVVSRRQMRVLKRMRTTALSDRGLLVGTLAPSLVLAVFQLLVFAVVNVVIGAPLPTDPVALVLAVLGGIALVLVAALATSVVTPSPERAQITTLPLLFLMLGVGVVAAIAPAGGWWPVLMVLPGAAVGDLVQLAMLGGSWSAAAGGLPAILPAIVALVVWPVLFGVFAARRFRWDPRH
jgi:ABC-2 type transport system permease protein